MQVRPYAQIDSALWNRFWSKVEKNDNNCWIWTAGRNGNGYGNFWFMGRTVGAHQMAYELSVGEITKGMCVLHSCDNGHLGCVRPDHLFLGTLKDNSQDMISKGRHKNQQKTHCPKGHEYTPENTRKQRLNTGSICRVCKTCHREQMARRKVVH
jgi:hypothetical protein